MKKLVLSAFVLSSMGCARFTYMPTTVQGDGWSFEAPGMNWQFTEGSTLIGTSLTNVGSRPMTVGVYEFCSSDLGQDPPTSSTLGFGTKYIGGRLGTVEATLVENSRPDGSDTIFFTAKLSRSKCVWTFVCEGDALARDIVGTVCGRMISSLEFHR